MDLLTPKDAARMAGVHPDTIRRAVNSGYLTGYRLPGTKALRVERKDLREWVHAGRVDPDPMPGKPRREPKRFTDAVVDLNKRRGA